MSTLVQLWGYALLAGAVALTVWVGHVWRQGWGRDEDGVIYHHHDYPVSAVFGLVLYAIGVFSLVYGGLGTLGLWGWTK